MCIPTEEQCGGGGGESPDKNKNTSIPPIMKIPVYLLKKVNIDFK